MATDMTRGSTTGHLIKFAIPLILGDMLQLTYNAVDSIIAGRFAGESALAGVGASSPVMNLMIFFIVGMCNGVSILMSRFYGARDYDRLHGEIGTSTAVGLVFTIITSSIALITAPYILRLMNTPADILPEATMYLRIVFAGMIFNFLYNIHTAALRGVGDSKTPILFLTISAVSNIVLDLVFVMYFKMGIAGIALSTLISQVISAVLCIAYIRIKIPLLRIPFKHYRIDAELLRSTISYSWVSAMQQTCLYVGRILIQSVINTLGVEAIAAYVACDKIDDFALQPERAIGNSMTTYISQNKGAGNTKNIGKGIKSGLIIGQVYYLLIATAVFFASRHLMGLYIKEDTSQVIGLGVQYLHVMSLLYFFPGLTNGIQGYFRGIGDLKVTLASTFTQIVVRAIVSFITIPRFGIRGIAYAMAVGWIAMLIFEIPIFIVSRRKSKEVAYE